MAEAARAVRLSSLWHHCRGVLEGTPFAKGVVLVVDGGIVGLICSAISCRCVSNEIRIRLWVFCWKAVRS